MFYHSSAFKLYTVCCHTNSLTMEKSLLQRPCSENLLQLHEINVLVSS